MKFNILFLVCLILLSGCAKKEIKEDIRKPEQKIESTTEKEQISTGWADQDTYTVVVVAENVDKGREKAKHQILQDIVKVRMMNGSMFTDITKINNEFKKPLDNGKVISEKKVEKGIEIYYQIKDEGLKQKFEKR